MWVECGCILASNAPPSSAPAHLEKGDEGGALDRVVTTVHVIAEEQEVRVRTLALPRVRVCLCECGCVGECMHMVVDVWL